jgi:two-component system sensor histidine kinase PhoQ
MPHSLRTRLLLASALVLPAFLGLTGTVLDQAFQQGMESGQRDRLETRIYALLAAADFDSQGRMRLPEALPEPRLAIPDSGLYAQVSGEEGGYQWRSQSMLGRDDPLLQPLAINQFRFRRIQHRGETLFVLGYAILWEDDQGRPIPYTLAVAEDARPLLAEIRAFRLTLFIGLGAAGVILLLIQWGLLHWGLRPLRRAAADIRAIEQGQQQRLSGDYPSELRGLTRNINTLLDYSHSERERYRNSLGDLAHSLKTPLAVLQNSADENRPGQLLATAREQIPRMNAIIQHQLKRASAASPAPIGKGASVDETVTKITSALAKVYRDKGLQWENRIPPDTRFPGDPGDLMELLGNLLDNAGKFARSRVRIDASAQPSLQITIEDDGPGIPAEVRQQVLHRGVRADELTPGQGIGLAVADEIVRAYQGELQIRESALGGACVVVTFGTRRNS